MGLKLLTQDRKMGQSVSLIMNRSEFLMTIQQSKCHLIAMASERLMSDRLSKQMPEYRGYKEEGEGERRVSCLGKMWS